MKKDEEKNEGLAGFVKNRMFGKKMKKPKGKVKPPTPKED